MRWSHLLVNLKMPQPSSFLRSPRACRVSALERNCSLQKTVFFGACRQQVGAIAIVLPSPREVAPGPGGSGEGPPLRPPLRQPFYKQKQPFLMHQRFWDHYKNKRLLFLH